MTDVAVKKMWGSRTKGNVIDIRTRLRVETAASIYSERLQRNIGQLSILVRQNFERVMDIMKQNGQQQKLLTALEDFAFTGGEPFRHFLAELTTFSDMELRAQHIMDDAILRSYKYQYKKTPTAIAGGIIRENTVRFVDRFIRNGTADAATRNYAEAVLGYMKSVK